MDEVVNRLGLTASRETVAAQIRANPAFRGAGGTFDPTLFVQLLQNNGLTEQGLVDMTVRDIAREQLLASTTAGMVAPPGLARLLYDFVNETRVPEYLLVTPEDAGQVPPPSAADLEAYYKANEAKFSSPEYRAFDYLQIGPDQVAGEIEVSDADVRAEFEARKAEFEKAEQRDVEQIAFPSKEEADAAAARIKSAAERRLSPEDLKLGSFAASGLDPRLSAAVFAVPAGGVTAPVQGPFGWVILHAARVIPAESQSFDQVQDRVRADLIAARAGAKVTELANALEDERGSGATLEEAAMKLGLAVSRLPGVDRQGLTPERSQAEVPPDPSFLEQVFQTETGEESDLFQGQAGPYFAIKMTGITAPAVRPLDSVREEVREGFVAEARTKLLQAKVQALSELAMKSGNLVEAGKSLGRAPIVAAPLKRGEMTNIVSTALNAQLFGAPAGTVLTGPAATGNGSVIVRVTRVEHPEPDLSSADYANFRRTAAQQLGESAMETLASAAREQAGVEIHQATIDRVLGETPQ
jgi:peptidyl-prolyl cis-trans isomerase D